MNYEFIILILTFILSGFFSGSEVAILSVTHIKAKQYVSRRKRNAKSLLYLKEHQSETLITILIGNNIVNILGAVLATKLTITYFGNAYLAIATGVLTFVTLTFGEIMPKILAAKNVTKFSLFVAPIIFFLSKLLFPLIWFFTRIAWVLSKLFRSSSREPLVTERDIKYFVKVGEKEGEINAHEKKIITNIFKFNDTRIKDVMTPKEKVFALDWNMNIINALPVLEEHSFTRVPVYDTSTNKMKGIVRIQDVVGILSRNEDTKTLKSITVYTVFLHSDKKIDYALELMRLRQVHMAIVIDKNRNFKGVVTMEDILEELVGEIYDESDKVDYLIKRISVNEWLVNTRIELRTLNKRLGLHLPITNDFKTLATFLKENISDPKMGSEFYYPKDYATFIVRRLFEGSIHRVFIKIKRKSLSRFKK